MLPPSLDSLASETLAAAGLMLHQLLAVLGLTVTACVVGRTLLGWLGVVTAGERPVRATDETEPGNAGPRPGSEPVPGPEPRGWLGAGAAVETAAMATSLGLVVVAQAGLVLGLAGLLKPVPILLALAGAHLASLQGWRRLLRGLGDLAPAPGPEASVARGGRGAGSGSDLLSGRSRRCPSRC